MKSSRSVSIITGFLIAFFAFGECCFGQLYWKRTLSGSGGCTLPVLFPLNDGNFLLAGSNETDGCLVKMRPNGDTIWIKTYVETGFNKFETIQSAENGTFLIAGSIRDSDKSFGWIVKVDNKGDTLWTKKFRCGEDYNRFSAMESTGDGNFLIAGCTTSARGGELDGWLVKINTDGDTLWTRTYQGAPKSYSGFFKIMPVDEDNFLIKGDYGSERWLLKITPSGDTLWTKTFEVGGSFSSYSPIIPTHDGNYLVAGYTDVDEEGKRTGLLVKLDPDGDTVWTKTYEKWGAGQFNTIQPAGDGNFLIAGFKSASGPEREDGWILKIDPMGTVIWNRTYQGEGKGMFTTLRSTRHGDFLILCHLSGLNSSTSVIYLVGDRHICETKMFTYNVDFQFILV